jgi:beta-carotene ketolase (CrtW type)
MSICPAPGRAAATPSKLPAWASKPDYAWTGVGVAACITISWFCLLRHALCLHVAATSGGHLAAVYLALVASYSGVFISAHDSMHGVVAPGRAALNNGLGRLFALLFAAFDYEALHTAHWQHHARPATHKVRVEVGIDAVK